MRRKTEAYERHAALRLALQRTAQAGHRHPLVVVLHSTDGGCHPGAHQPQPACSGNHHNVQVSGGMGGEEKWSSLSLMKRNGTGDSREETRSLL